METSEANSEEGNHFYERFSAYTDEEILEILRKHKDYQDRAIIEAVKIAIDRKLINSEQDLMSPDFQYSKSKRFTLFPDIENAYHRNRVIYSIFRYLYVLSLLPIIYGGLKYAEGNSAHTIGGLLIGATWFVFSILLSRTKKPVFFVFLFAMLFLVVASIGSHIVKTGNLQSMDMMILLIALLLSSYLLFYLRKLIRP